MALPFCSGKRRPGYSTPVRLAQWGGEQVGSASLGTGRYGFDMEQEVTLINAYDVGTYTVTAP
jgi:hypothetical protein